MIEWAALGLVEAPPLGALAYLLCYSRKGVKLKADIPAFSWLGTRVCARGPGHLRLARGQSASSSSTVMASPQHGE